MYYMRKIEKKLIRQQQSFKTIKLADLPYHKENSTL